MTSDHRDSKAPEEAYVWIWLPGATAPVVAGRIERDGKRLIFNYGQSYLDANDRIPIYEPELPLRQGSDRARSRAEHGRMPCATPPPMRGAVASF